MDIDKNKNITPVSGEDVLLASEQKAQIVVAVIQKGASTPFFGRRRAKPKIARYPDVNHISDHDLERYYPGMVKEAVELAVLEEHLLACPACVERAESTLDYVDALRAGVVKIRED